MAESFDFSHLFHRLNVTRSISCDRIAVFRDKIIFINRLASRISHCWVRGTELTIINNLFDFKNHAISITVTLHCPQLRLYATSQLLVS
jgi:hypothetical protein